MSAALIFALVMEHLHVYYEHGQWLTQAQGATHAADWLAHSKRNMYSRNYSALTFAPSSI